MSKTDRLMQVLQILRGGTPPVLAENVAAEMGLSQRTVYRYIEELRGLGAVIDGAAGFGYRLIEDPALPPMLFDRDEIEAIVLGLREVMEIGDPVLAEAAKNSLAKLRAGLPPSLQHQMEHAVLTAKRFHPPIEIHIDISALRQATRDEQEIELQYETGDGVASRRVVRPLSIVYLDQHLVLVADCLLRQDFRAFRVDRIKNFRLTGHSFAPHRVALLREAIPAIRGGG